MMQVSSPWLITRPSPEAEADAAALMARGVPADPFPPPAAALPPPERPRPRGKPVTPADEP